MYGPEIVVAAAGISFILGFLSHLFLSSREITLEKRVAIILLVAWLSFAMVAYLQKADLILFFNAAGMAAIANLLGIKTGEMLPWMRK